MWRVASDAAYAPVGLGYRQYFTITSGFVIRSSPMSSPAPVEGGSPVIVSDQWFDCRFRLLTILG